MASSANADTALAATRAVATGPEPRCLSAAFGLNGAALEVGAAGSGWGGVEPFSSGLWVALGEGSAATAGSAVTLGSTGAAALSTEPVAAGTLGTSCGVWSPSGFIVSLTGC